MKHFSLIVSKKTAYDMPAVTHAVGGGRSAEEIVDRFEANGFKVISITRIRDWRPLGIALVVLSAGVVLTLAAVAALMIS